MATVNIKTTSKKYHGRMAETYDEKRMKQERWDFENAVVKGWLMELRPKKVVDCPAGTGRFFSVYRDLDCTVHAIDISETMLKLAQKKVPRGSKKFFLEKGDATDIEDRGYDGAVCVRFLDLIDEEAMRKVVTELAKAKKFIICTIRLGDKYVPKSNTAEHDEKKFRALVKKLGFTIADTARFREGSWHVLLLKRV